MREASQTSKAKPLNGADLTPPRDAATLVIVSTTENGPKVLMGRRRADQVFLPNKYVFPGGRVDASDAEVPAQSELALHEREKLMLAMDGAPSPSRARAIALAAIRETFEETGLIVGAPCRVPSSTYSEPWQTFLALGVAPDLSRLSYFARAITPPGRPRRYDTRFFVVDAAAIAGRADTTDGELSSIDWYPLNTARALDLPTITRLVIENLAQALNSGLARPIGAPVPFYFQQQGTFKRVLLSLESLHSYDEILYGEISD
jgi:8-oxo-dGTP pyrophosphatase MutT (NUDIX family)